MDKNSGETSSPDYICFNKDRCEDEVLLPWMRYNLTDPFNNNSTCVATENIKRFIGSATWRRILFEVYSAFSKCSMPHQLSFMTDHSNLYSCVNSSKMISKHRLKDGIDDCVNGDDESYQHSCSLNNNQHRFKCTDQSQNIVCLSHVLVGNGQKDCLDGLDEKDLNGQESPETRISFQTMCDGFTELLPVLINGTNQTDETECFHFPCNNTYTRCDGTWNCLDGADEVNCEWPPLCPSLYHMCLSKLTSNLTCLSIEYANNGIVDCFGSSDERHFCQKDKTINTELYRCEEGNQCIPGTTACFICTSSDSSNDTAHFCNTFKQGGEETVKPPLM